MPTSYIKKLHEQHKGSIAELERKWEEAKAAAAKQGRAENWAYVTSIFNKMVGASTVFAALKTTGHGHVVARANGWRARCILSVCKQCAADAQRIEAELKSSVKLNAVTRLMSIV